MSQAGMYFVYQKFKNHFMPIFVAGVTFKTNLCRVFNYLIRKKY